MVSEEVPGLFDSIQGVIEQHGIIINNFMVAKDLEKKEVTTIFALQGRDVPPHMPLNRRLVQEVIDLRGVKKVEIS